MKQIVACILLLWCSFAFIACDKDMPGNPISLQVPPAEDFYTPEELNNLLITLIQCYDRDIIAPPDVVNAAFRNQFQNAYDIEWETCANLYKVNFEIARLDYDAVYDNQGNLLLYKYDIPNRELPAAVKQTINAKYSGYCIDDVDKVILANFICYDVDIERNDYDIWVYIKEDGTFLYEDRR